MKKHIAALLLTIICLISGQNSVLAFNTGYETEELDAETWQKYMDSACKRLTKQFDDRPIKSFAVNDYGEVALALIECRDGASFAIQVYDDSGSFQYTLAVPWFMSGKVEWDDRNLIISNRHIRKCILVNPEGKVLDAREIIVSSNNADYSDSRWAKRFEEKNGAVYEMSRPILNDADSYFGNYSTLVKTAADGTETVFYDSKVTYAIERGKFLVMMAGFPFFIVIVFRCIILQRQGRMGGLYWWKEIFRFNNRP